MNSESTPPVPPAPQAPVKRVKLTQTLPTDRIGFSKQPEILRAFAAAYEKTNAPVSNDDVGKFVALSGSTVSQINAFFLDVGLLIRADAGKFTPTAPTLEYFKLHQFSPERAWSKLLPAFEKSWFGQELIGKLKFRPIDENEAITDLALASNAEKGYEPQLKIALDWLVQTGAAIRDGSSIKLPNNTAPKLDAKVDEKPPLFPKGSEDEETGLFRSVLPLDASSKRKVVVWAPPTITGKELERIKAWLAVQILVEEKSD